MMGDPADIIAGILDSQGDRSPEPSADLAARILAALAAAGVEVLAGGCSRCGADASEHWCADVEGTFE
jgi:hypothetical protein